MITALSIAIALSVPCLALFLFCLAMGEAGNSEEVLFTLDVGEVVPEGSPKITIVESQDVSSY